MALEVKEIKPHIGSKIIATKDELLSGENSTQIRELLEARGVVVLPQIGFTSDEQVAFTRTLGKFAPETKDAEGKDVVSKITLDESQSAAAVYLRASMFWHLDGTMNTVPIFASILSGNFIPPEGAQTEFCSTYAAYEELPPEEQSEYEKLTVLHGAWASFLYFQPEPATEFLQKTMAIGDNKLPLVWKHKSGRKSLVLGCTAYKVDDMDYKEGILLLHKLRNWATSEQFVYRHEWTEGDLVMWDNTGTMHRAMPYDPASGRMLHRTKLEGEEAFAYA